VYNLHKEVGDAELFALFQGFGTILSTRVCVARPSGRSKVGPPGALLV
jgi:RNA recognition motif-containing protein